MSRKRTSSTAVPIKQLEPARFSCLRRTQEFENLIEHIISRALRKAEVGYSLDSLVLDVKGSEP
jgi:hypothetical protein